MSVDKQLLRKIYAKTDGNCHICHRKLSFQNYGKVNELGAWQIEHSVAKANGGTDHINNLFPACNSCNREKGTLSSKTARGRNGKTRAPHSKAKKKKIKQSNTATGVIIGGLLGSVAGPAGAVIGAALGGAIGNSSSPKK